MPHIHVLVTQENKFVVDLMSDGITKQKLRETFSRFFNIDSEEVAIIGDVLSGDSLKMSVNVLPLELVIDMGAQKIPTTDERVAEFAIRLEEVIPALANIEFGVWVREMSINGFYKSS